MKLIQGYYIPNNDNHFEKYFTQFDHYQEAQRNRALSHVSEWENALDIGANIGLWSKDLTSFFSKTYCFEPNFNCLDCLKRNINIAKAEIHNYALGSKSAFEYMYCPDSTGGSSFVNKTKFLGHDNAGKEIWDKFEINVSKQKVEIKTLDSLDLENINFIKIDVQNYELEVLKGAYETLRKNDPVVCIEEYKTNVENSDEINFLQSLNFSVIDKIGKEVILKKLKI